MPILHADQFRHYVERFNAMEPEGVVNLISNAGAWEWMAGNVPLFACPDSTIEEIYYFRWWSFRKHIKQTPAGLIVTEFIEPVRHAGTFNSISCATGHHLAEGRWLRDQSFLDEYTRFWFRSNEGKPEYRFHRYSSWIEAAMYERYLVTGDKAILLDLFDDLIADYAAWENEKLGPDGLFWQFDVWDGMEESITGSRKHKNARPTINSYMYANALAIAAIATMAGKDEIALAFREKASSLKRLVHERLWDSGAKFFKAQKDEDGLSDAREEIGFIPWCFNLPEAGCEEAWGQLIDPQGFWAPFGITTAERRHAKFRSHGVGKCEWDGAVWPFATSQTLGALAKVLRGYQQRFVNRGHYLEAMRTYARCHQMNGRPYIGEYLDEKSGEWLKGDNPRSRYYNHSTFADLVIGGLVGIVPREDDTIEIDPLLPEQSWDWFCLDGVRYHGRDVAILWDRDGKKFGRDAGLSVFAGNRRIAHSTTLSRVMGTIT
ncbi:MAG TPA: glycosyl hydrolase family 65 protein [Tepidisphaeraceae bacterium]|jgi:hypothetical protein|nr:glycosyl hydrolase family 65 protein [Tepidisphaeraceae bacterium]